MFFLNIEENLEENLEKFPSHSKHDAMSIECAVPRNLTVNLIQEMFLTKGMQFISDGHL